MEVPRRPEQWDVERICPVCGERYTASRYNYRRQVTCSDCRAPTEMEPWDVERVCASPGCDETYRPPKNHHTRQLHCSNVCADRQRKLRYYYRRKEEGLCIECGGEKETTITRCASCSEEDAARSRRWRESNREDGNCVRCGHPLPHGSIANGEDVCPGCIQEARIYEETGDYTHGRERGESCRPNPVEESLEET